jgi:glycosyltransferase involved in cell wall biosynthesis
MYEMFKLCDLILTPSQYVKNFFLKYYPSFESKMTALPLGIPPLKGHRQIKTSDGEMRFCYFGNIVPIKGLHVLIDAFKTLPRGRASLTIYGSRTPWTENYYDRLKQEASGFPVDFRGPFKREGLAEALSDQDIFILPSIWPETFSIVIREANSLGLPVIASRIGAIPEAVDEGVNGLLFEPGNVEDLRRCMLQFIESPRLVQEMALKMPKPKSMTEHVVELLEIYQGIVRKKG